MHSVGACRQCAVKLFKDENDTRGRIVMACMTPAADGMRISIEDPEAEAFRAGVIEWLMVNHPHDCPVCDEGGECHLQDMTVMTGHVYRRYRFAKRTHRNQDLGPFVNHEMNRCIQCYRCVRFYRDYAGGRDFDVFGWHDHVYFGRHEDGALESEFSGNLVEVCPTGVFTDKTLKQHYTRKWDLQTAPSVCVHCGLGCNTIPGERYGELRRIRNRYNGEVNGYFLCDRGRYGYEFVNQRPPASASPLRREAAAAPSRSPRRRPLQHGRGISCATGRAIGIGSPRASLEVELRPPGARRAGAILPGVAGRRAAPAPAMIEHAPDADPRARRRSARWSVRRRARPRRGRDPNGAPCWPCRCASRSFSRPTRGGHETRIPEWLDECLREAVQEDAVRSSSPRRTRRISTTGGRARFAPRPTTSRASGSPSRTRSTPPRRPCRISPGSFSARPKTIAAALKRGRAAARRLRPELRQRGRDRGGRATWRAALCKAGLGRPPVLHRARVQQPGPGAHARRRPRVGAGEARRRRITDTVIVLENDLFRRLDPASASALLASYRARHRPGSPDERRRRAGRVRPARRDFRRSQRDARQQRGPRPALLPGLRAPRTRSQGPGAGWTS